MANYEYQVFECDAYIASFVFLADALNFIKVQEYNDNPNWDFRVCKKYKEEKHE